MNSSFFSVSLPVAATTTVLRYAINHVLTGARLGKRKTENDKTAKLVEEVWLLVASACLLLLSTFVAQMYNNRCSFFDQSGCFEGWPYQEDSPHVDATMAAFLGWYMHGVVKSLVPGIGLRSGIDMLGHHLLTLALFACVQLFSVQRIGFLVLALLNFSNPFMHIAKVLHNVRAPKAATAPAFMVFAIAFAASRCVCFPQLIITALRAAHGRYLEGDARVVLPTLVCIFGLLSLQVLQFYWLGRIGMVIKNGGMQPRTPAPAPASAVAERPAADACPEAPRSPLRTSDVSSATSVPPDAVSDEEPLDMRENGEKEPFVRLRPFFDSANGDGGDNRI